MKSGDQDYFIKRHLSNAIKRIIDTSLRTKELNIEESYRFSLVFSVNADTQLSITEISCVPEGL